MIGQVKWFNKKSGYGFVTVLSGVNKDEDVFVHHSEINVEGYKTLKAGQAVTFDVVQGDKGLHATNIIPLDSNIEPDNISVRSDQNASANAEIV